MVGCIYSNSISKSILTDGFTIPVDKWDIFSDRLGIKLQKGEHQKINIWIGDEKYSAIYTYVNLKGDNAGRTVYQIRYSTQLANRLRDIYQVDPDNCENSKDTIELYTRAPGELEMKCYPQVNIMTLHEVISKIMNEYVEAKREPIAGHPMYKFFNKDIPAAIYGTRLVEQDKYLVGDSIGIGNWVTIPWVAIYDKSITTTATKGVYIVYLLSKDGNSLYLTLNQGCTEIKEGNRKKDTIQILHERAQDVREHIDGKGFKTDDNIKLGDGSTRLEGSGVSEFYQDGMIFYKEYKKDNIPSNEELNDDLKKMMDIYKEYAEYATYNPHLSKEDWVKILTDKKYITDNLLNVLARYLDIGGEASVIQMVQKYGNSANYYKSPCVTLAKKLVEEGKCEEPTSKGVKKYWPVLFTGRSTTDEEEGSFVWKLRDELKEALKDIDIMQYMKKDGEDQLSTKESLEHIKKYIAAKGFTFDDGLLDNYYLSLKSKPFVILAGISGTGKTRLVRLFAEAIGATSENGRYKLVPVRPDWSDSSDLFGHVNLNDKFNPGAIIDFVKKAESDEDNPYFLCLDEMNLARVEYYLSDVLSIIETRELVDGRIITDPLINDNYYGGDETARDKYGVIRIPENLYIIGTVNMDETTFPFSKKVLDRANTIEFSNVDLLSRFDGDQENIEQIQSDNSLMKSEYVLFTQCGEDSEFVKDICDELQTINKILEKANAQIGYRVRDEIVFYMLNNKKANLLDRNVAFDYEIMQKILPRIQGSSNSVKLMLCELFKHCADDYEGYQTEDDDVSSKMFKAAQKENCKYKKCAYKIAFMVRRFEEDGFTAYWL